MQKLQMSIKKKKNPFFKIKLIFPSQFHLKFFLKNLIKKNKISLKKFSFQFLKKKKKQFVFLKSPHVNKQSKEHFCVFKYQLIINTVSSFKILLKIIKKIPFFINFYINYYTVKNLNAQKKSQNFIQLLKRNFLNKMKKISN